ncbi:MAG TPA: hypothetical protein VFY23_03090 [Candidatus Limnocylindrales bacterium]|nr:hypothetical protein [Candidatus Limnocylindrales bacterium]
MLDWLDPNPAAALLKIAGFVAVVGVAIAAWFQLWTRVKRYGSRPLGGVLLAAGLVLLILALIPGLFTFEVGIVVLVAAFFFIYRPDVVVKLSGGPRREWEALRAGRELFVLVAERGGPRAAREDPEISAKLAALSSLETPATRDYLSLVRQTLFADPSDPALDSARGQLAAADAALRGSLGERPVWEREYERRARGEAA